MRDWLIATRTDAGLSQKYVAEKAGISQPSYCNIEKGKRSPEVTTAKAIAEVLNFEWTKFFKEDGA